MNNISVTKVNEYDLEQVTSAMRLHFDRLNISRTLKKGMKVLIKPNLLMKRRPEEATTTHPVVVAAVIQCLKELDITDIVISDSPGGPYTRSALSGIYQASGMTDIAKHYGVKLNDDFKSFERENPDGLRVHSFTLITPVQDADYIIDVAKLKTHAMTGLSGAVKNLFGTVPGLLKPEFHLRFPDKKDFCNMLIDLCETVKPDLCIVDAIVSMEGDGPSGGTPRKTGLVLASKSPYAMDVALCKLIGLETSEVLTVSNAIERGLSPKSYGELQILGDELSAVPNYKMPSVKQIDFLNSVPKPLHWIAKPIFDIFLVSKPVINKGKCIGCGKCAESCPAKTIEIIDKKAVISYDKCIKCFCCHEMCPPRAIKIKRFKLFDL